MRGFLNVLNLALQAEIKLADLESKPNDNALKKETLQLIDQLRPNVENRNELFKIMTGLQTNLFNRLKKTYTGDEKVIFPGTAFDTHAPHLIKGDQLETSSLLIRLKREIERKLPEPPPKESSHNKLHGSLLKTLYDIFERARSLLLPASKTTNEAMREFKSTNSFAMTQKPDPQLTILNKYSLFCYFLSAFFNNTAKNIEQSLDNKTASATTSRFLDDLKKTATNCIKAAVTISAPASPMTKIIWNLGAKAIHTLATSVNALLSNVKSLFFADSARAANKANKIG